MKTLILVHGRSWKPPEAELKKLWLGAIEHGIKRDHADALDAYRSAKKEFVYYGAVSNDFLHRKTKEPVPDDTDSRQQTLADLKQWRADQFSRKNYNKLPGKESFREGAASVLSPLLRFFTLSDELIGLVAPDMREYWKGEDSDFGSAVREPLVAPLERALKNDRSTCVLAHSLGSMIAYDTFWKFSYRSEYKKYHAKKIDLFLSIGSPLGDGTVKDGLFGARASGARKYPANLRRWVNVAAEDDYISHDSTVRGDYSAMRRHGLIDSIVDHKIYNLAVRKGKSNPHHSGGYLIHPTVIGAIVGWLQS